MPKHLSRRGLIGALCTTQTKAGPSGHGPFQAYAPAAANMIAKREVRAMSPVALNSRSH
jgi:hypothetical protein